MKILKAMVKASPRETVKFDKNYFRPNEVLYLRGDARKAFKVLNFKIICTAIAKSPNQPK